MISVVLYAVIALALATAAGLSVLSFYQASNTIAAHQGNAAAMDTALAVLQANVRDLASDGVRRVPAGEVVDGVTTLPAWLGAPRRSPWGTAFAYCPSATTPLGSGPSGATIDEVRSAAGTSYRVATVASAATEGRPYVVASEPLPDLGTPGPLALLLASMPGDAVPPACDEVAFESGIFTVPRGVVRALLPAVSRTGQLEAATHRLVLYVSADAAARDAGDRTGSSPENPASLAGALSIWATNRPRVTELRLAPGSYGLTPAEASALALPGRPDGGVALALVTEGSGGGAPAVVTLPTGSYDLTYDLSLDAVTLGNAALVTSGRVRLSRAFVDDLTVTGGALTIDGGTRIENLEIRGGEAVVLAPTASPAVVAGLRVAAGTLSVVGSLSVVTRVSSPVEIYGGRLEIAGGGRLAIAYDTGAIPQIWHPPLQVFGGRVELTGLPGGPPASLTVQSRASSTPGVALVGGSLSAMNALILVVGPVSAGFEVSGAASLRVTEVRFDPDSPRAPVAVRLQDGGELVLGSGTQLGTGRAPTVGIDDESGAAIFGRGAEIRVATTCWLGPLFAQSEIPAGAAPGQPGTSKVTPLPAVEPAIAETTITDLNDGTSPQPNIRTVALPGLISQLRLIQEATVASHNASEWLCIP